MKGERLGEFEELVLLCVQHLNGEAHARGVQTALAQHAQREVTLGAIYAALDRAQRKGWATSFLGEPEATRGGKARRIYQVTDGGREALLNSRAVRDRLWGLSHDGTPS